MLFKQVPSFRGAKCFICTDPSLWNVFLPDFTGAMWRGCLYFRDRSSFEDMDLKRHEYRHHLQWRRCWFFHLQYIIANVRYGYARNPFELDAWPRWFSYPSRG